MYASQTKRLCVREATSDETRARHNPNSSVEGTTESSTHQHLQPAPSTSNPDTQLNITITNLRGSCPIVPGSSQTPRAVKRTYSTISPLGGLDTAKPEPSGFRSGSTERDSSKMTASAKGNTNSDAGDENQTPNKTPPASFCFQQNNSKLTSVVNNKHEGSVPKYTDHNSEQDLIERLASETSEEVKLELILSLRNLITACNKKKSSLIKNPKFRKTLCIIDRDNESSPLVKAQFALLLCSIAKGTESNVDILVESLVDEKIYNLIVTSEDDSLIEACLRCFRVLTSKRYAWRLWLLYGNPESGSTEIGMQGDIGNPKKIIEYARKTGSFIVQECIADIFATTCRRSKEQSILFESGALTCITQLLESNSNRLIVSALNWLSSLCLKNKTISLEATKAVCPSGSPLLSRLISLMSKDECYELQFLSAKCYSQIYKALAPKHLDDKETKIVTRVLPTLVRMVQGDKPSRLRAEAAECIAYLIECDTRLQEIASICEHLITSLASMLEQDLSSFDDLKELYQNNSHSSPANYRYSMEGGSMSRVSHGTRQSRATSHTNSSSNNQTILHENGVKNRSIRDTGVSNDNNQNMKRAAFLALAALASTLEPIRKKIFETGIVMEHLVKNLVEGEPMILKSVLTCLLSLSRSVQQLRTSFAENKIYTALKSLLSTQSDDILILVLAILCNISLDFSPGKQQFLDSITINTLCNFTKGTDPYLKLHGMWILMNMVYQLRDKNLKFQILKTLGPDHILTILEMEDHEELLLKTLGFLRNLLSQKPHIDAIMSDHGDKIMQSLMRVLERRSSNRIIEQALCVLTNIADGSSAKSLIMNNRTIMSYLSRVISDDKAGDMRLAAICCITNLAHEEYEGSYERVDELRKYGIEEKLKSLLNTSDPILSDRVRTAYNQFFRSTEDK